MGPEAGDRFRSVEGFLAEARLGPGFDRLLLGIREIADEHDRQIAQLWVSFDSPNQVDPGTTFHFENAVHQHQIEGLLGQQADGFVGMGSCLDLDIEMLADCRCQIPVIVRTVADCQDALCQVPIPPAADCVVTTPPLIGPVGL